MELSKIGMLKYCKQNNIVYNSVNVKFVALYVAFCDVLIIRRLEGTLNTFKRFNVLNFVRKKNYEAFYNVFKTFAHCVDDNVKHWVSYFAKFYQNNLDWREIELSNEQLCKLFF